MSTSVRARVAAAFKKAYPDFAGIPQIAKARSRREVSAYAFINNEAITLRWVYSEDGKLRRI